MNKLVIAYLYPQEMNIYGDRGNVLSLVKRLQWRGYTADVTEVGTGDQFDFRRADIVFGGGGQDRGQLMVADDLQRKQANLQAAAADGVVMLTICGTYQLFGHGFRTKSGQLIPGISLFKAQTVGSNLRMIGNIVVNTPYGELVGFENHSGQTILEVGQEPLGRVVRGFGNNSEQQSEGAIAHNVFGSYLHGPLLPKNPTFADELLQRALFRRFGDSQLKPLDDQLEHQAATIAKSRT
ncbi:glutamine amidotransferase [Candidatus Microgenomates bacterium]|nr:glutamine amidotransferase [Candidatus Microgenomates bacterium]